MEEGIPRVIVVGAASRDLAPDDRRGWRLGGGVSYGALALARLGIPTGAVIGVDAAAATATELDLLRLAGVDLRLVPLAQGPVFENVETPDGRVQRSAGPSDPLPSDAVPDAWRGAAGWMFAPVAGELAETWAEVPDGASLVALGWQGLLRELPADGRVLRREPGPSAIARRADLVSLSRDDVAADLPLAALTALLRPGATLTVTRGADGGIAMTAAPEGPGDLRAWPALPPDRLVDPTGAGDVFLATLLAARLDPRLVGERPGHGHELHLAAAASSLLCEGVGLLGVPERGAVARRMARSLSS